ncbi:hypothetical protein TFLX_00597 [Thermoflexales bacterium]|nr:hypothetical protein TFLX_00597 [Thermoflexales bacterium]
MGLFDRIPGQRLGIRFYFGGSVASLNVQQFLNANPVLGIVVLFVIGIVIVLAARIARENAGCLGHVGCAIVLVVIIFFLLRFLLFHV